MEHNIINTGDYLLIVDESEIKEGDYIYNSVSKEIYKFKEINVKYEHKIMAHLPLNGAKIIETLPLLPPLEDEVEKLCKQEAEKFHNKIKHDDWDIYNQLVYEDTEMIKIGYNKAKEKYKYTEEDLRRVEKCYLRECDYDIKYKGQIIQRIINEKSLQQTKMPVGFKCEMEKPSSSFGAHMANFFGQSISKTITNSQGLIQWIGEYIY